MVSVIDSIMSSMKSWSFSLNSKPNLVATADIASLIARIIALALAFLFIRWSICGKTLSRYFFPSLRFSSEAIDNDPRDDGRARVKFAEESKE